MATENKKNEIEKYCKKCGCELPHSSKHQKCDSCRRETVKKVVDGVESGIGVVFTVIALPRIGQWVKSKIEKNK